MRSETLSDVTFSPGSEDGTARYRSQLGPLIEKYGLDQLLASLSPRQASLSGLLTSGTSGLSGSISLSSASLQLSLANRLHRSPALRGSTLFKLTWKVRITPSGRPISALRASALRTSGSDCGSWPTTRATDGLKGSRSPEGVAKELARKGNLDELASVATLTSWAAPSARDFKSNEGSEAFHQARAEQTRGKPLSEQAHQMVAWSTPRANKRGFPDAHGSREEPSGLPAIGSPAPTEKRGQLSPDHSRWLMGYSAGHLSCVPMEMPSSRKSRPNS
jgi:hypothetical protein